MREDLVTVETLCKHFSDRLTEYEEGFLQSVRRRLESRIPLTVPQRTLLDKLAQQHLGKGQTVSEADLWE